LQESDNKALLCGEDIARRKNEMEKDQRLSYMVSRMLSPKRIIEDTRPWDKEFSIGNNCIGCRTCEKVCQMNNIVMVNGKPEFQHNCQRCMACIQYCPQKAIGFKGKPLSTPRYHHPEFPAEELIRVIEDRK
jgi:ferredoxin